MIVMKRGAGCGGRGGADNERHVTRTAKSCGPDARYAGVKFLRSSRGSGATVAREHRLTGEHDISRQTIAQGMSDCFR